MSGLALTWNGDSSSAELTVLAADTPDPDLTTAVIISLFTDRRVASDDPLLDQGADPRGWWGDVAPPVEGDQIGSRLWTLRRQKRTAEVVRLARDFAQEALTWMTADDVAAAVTVETQPFGLTGIALSVVIDRAPGPARHRFDFLWEPA